MAAALQSDAFWIALEQSGLLTAQQLSDAKQTLLQGGNPTAEDVSRHLIDRGWLTPFQAERLLEGRSRGFFYDRYQIVDLLGLGGMGWVYQAVDSSSGEVVALKVLRDEFRHDPGLLARFHQEARVGMQLNHPNIMRTLALGSAGGLPYMIMEFAPGPNLLELLLERRRLPWEQACDFARQAALGLEYAHQKGIVHRDVKPQNLLIDSTGRVRLLDFGLSMTSDGETGDEFSLAMIFGHESVGTLDYAAPEQVADSLAADARSDVYSLGGTLFVALTGVSPARIADPKVAGGRRSVRDFVPTIPAGVAQIVDKMLETDPERRFASAQETADALAPWSKPLPIEFNFAALLRERKKFAQERMASLSQARASGPKLARSTARPGSVSSAIDAVDDEKAVRRAGAGSPSALWDKGRTAGTLRGPALQWTRDDRLGPTAALVSLNSGVRIPLIRDRLLIGRGNECDLQLNDNAVSSRHCELQRNGPVWSLRDLESRNGTQVNGSAIRQHTLRNGDEILLGNQQRFRFDSPAAVFPATSPWSLWGAIAVVALGLFLVVGVLVWVVAISR